MGWLIDPIRKIVEIYHPDRQAEMLQNPTQLFGENVLLGFVLDLESIF